MPDQRICKHTLKWGRFNSTNGLVQDPAAELEQEAIERPWSSEEKRIFFEKFLLHHKVWSASVAALSSEHAVQALAEPVNPFQLSHMAIVGTTGPNRAQSRLLLTQQSHDVACRTFTRSRLAWTDAAQGIVCPSTTAFRSRTTLRSSAARFRQAHITASAHCRSLRAQLDICRM